ncbi:MAG: ferrochelatase [Bacteroidetes bacterium]|nr:ferrochelatase [Bacteroidota bacterium]
MTRKVLIIVNTGTPDSSSVKDVRRYLSEFLNDRHVIDLPWLIRKFLVNIIIVPFRAQRSSRKYSRLWTEEGSPLLINLEKLVSKLRLRLNGKFEVIGAMRYGSPSLKKVLKDLSVDPPASVIVFPLYTQYASSTTGSVNELTISVLGGFEANPELKIVKQFYDHPLYLESVVWQVRKFDLSACDHILFSYHGLPMRQIQKIHPEKDCASPAISGKASCRL